MSYGASAALQAAVYQRLMADSALGAMVGGAIFDAAPVGAVPATYVAIGPETARDASDKTGRGAVHDFAVSVVTDEAGFHTAKAVAAAVSDALTGAQLLLLRGRLVGLWFLRAAALRGTSGQRRIDLMFRARIED